jgi:ribosome-binding protein aMBF1 (putative translation factor)
MAIRHKSETPRVRPRRIEKRVTNMKSVYETIDQSNVDASAEGMRAELARAADMTYAEVTELRNRLREYHPRRRRLGALVHSARERAGLRPGELAKRMGTNLHKIVAIESGRWPASEPWVDWGRFPPEPRGIDSVYTLASLVIA